MIGYTRTDLKMLDVQNVSLTLGGTVILRDVNVQVFDVEREAVTGQVVCFLGPSGIGKTQLSRIIAGLQEPTSGVVTLMDGKLTNAGVVGMVPQNYPLFEFATVAQNIAIAGRRSGLNAADTKARADRYIDALGLSTYLRRFPYELSGGTRQRVAIVRQMMCTDHYLVMDEPFSGLDPIMKQRTSELITRLAGMDTFNTIILVTHDISEGLAVSDTVWLMGRDSGQPGARIVEQYDLAAMDLCWHKDIQHDKRFLEFARRIKDRFQTLSLQA